MRLRQEAREIAAHNIKSGSLLSLSVIGLPVGVVFFLSGVHALTIGEFYPPDRFQEFEKKLKMYRLVHPQASLREAYEYAKENPTLLYSKEDYDLFIEQYRIDRPTATFKEIDEALNFKKAKEAKELEDALERLWDLDSGYYGD